MSDDTVHLLNERCVPVLLNSFYGGNSQWFKANDFMDGMWRDVRGGNGDWTVLAPDGRFLDREIKAGWQKWQALPAARRRPGAVAVQKRTAPPKGAPPQPPRGALVVRVRQRNLQRTANGLDRLTERDIDRLNRAAVGPHKGYWQSAYFASFQDALWLPREEWQALIPPAPRQGERRPLPPRLRDRLLLWHLTNRTFCVGISWEKTDIRAAELALVVEEVAPVLRLRLEGKVLLKMDGTAEDKKIFWGRTEHGYEAALLGWLEYDRRRQAFTRFDVAALGDYWGGDCEGGRRNVGRLPLAITFELPPPEARESLPLPCGGVALDRYLNLRSQFR